METATALALAIVGMLFVLGLYKLGSVIIKRAERQRLRRQGRIILWNYALERVRQRKGYFLIARSYRKADVFYIDGELSNDEDKRAILRDRASLVEGYPRSAVTDDLKAIRVDGRCLEIDLDALDV